ncbi:MAG: hypothetical protein QM715_11995 [Nibricoccus sp.]
MGNPFFSNLNEFVVSLLKTLPLALLFALPFIFSGLILGILLSNPDFPTQRIYFWDLTGSALGALAILPVISWLGVENVMLVTCAALLLVCALTFPPRQKKIYILSAATTVAIVASFVYAKRLYTFRYPEGTELAVFSKAPLGFSIDYTQWDPVARIEVSSIPAPSPTTVSFPSLIGTNEAFLRRYKRMLTQNNFAFTYAVAYDGTPESLNGIQETIYSSAYVASTLSNPKTAIIGVGGGFDVLTAINFNARDITGIEVNKATLNILQKQFFDYFRHWTTDPRVHLVYDDGRHYLASSSDQFDIIQLSGVDSYSGTPGAAHVFSESYLYTTEALDLYLSKLTNDGIINIMRMEHYPPREMLRVMTTAAKALRNIGVQDPTNHLVMVAQSNGAFMALLIKKNPFSPQEIKKLSQWVGGNKYLTLAVAPYLTYKAKNTYRYFLEQWVSGKEARFFDETPFVISPATDDRPFFFNFSRWNHLPGLFKFTRWAEWPDLQHRIVPVMEITLILMLILVGIVALFCVWWPLKGLSRVAKVPAPRQYALIFASTAIGYLAVEVALLQKFGLYLGHPNYALSVVLAALLFATGLGSLTSKYLIRRLGGIRILSYTFCISVVAECLIAFPSLRFLTFNGFAARALVVITLVFPLGLLLGVFLPTAVDQLKGKAPEYVPWGWGINGIFSVLAPILSVAFSMTWGITALFLLAIPIYLFVGCIFPKSEPPQH